MTRYKTKTPRHVLAIASIVMSALTLGVAVILPAMTAVESGESRIVAASRTVPRASAPSGAVSAVPSPQKQSTLNPHAALPSATHQS